MGTTNQTITIACPVCGKSHQLPASARGKNAKCGCGHRFVVEPASVDKRVSQDKPASVDNMCRRHPSEAAVAKCLKCNTLLCRQCALRTKSGKHVCRECAPSHAAAPKPSASSHPTTVPTQPAPVELEIVTPEIVTPEIVTPEIVEPEIVEVPPGTLVEIPNSPSTDNPFDRSRD